SFRRHDLFIFNRMLDRLSSHQLTQARQTNLTAQEIKDPKERSGSKIDQVQNNCRGGRLLFLTSEKDQAGSRGSVKGTGRTTRRRHSGTDHGKPEHKERFGKTDWPALNLKMKSTEDQ